MQKQYFVVEFTLGSSFISIFTNMHCCDISTQSYRMHSTYPPSLCSPNSTTASVPCKPPCCFQISSSLPTSTPPRTQKKSCDTFFQYLPHFSQTVSTSSIHFTGNERILFFGPQQYSTLSIHHIFLVHSSLGRHLGPMYHLTPENSAVIHVGI